MPLPAPPARRAVFLTAAALVALGTLVYAFAAREAPAESVDAPLAADGERVADVELRADDCLALDARALDAIAAALRLGCDARDGAPVPTPGAGDEGSLPGTDTPPPTRPGVPTAVPTIDTGDGATTDAPAPPDPDDAPPASPPPVPSPSLDAPTPALPTPAPDEARPDRGSHGGAWSWWNVPEPGDAPWPDSLYDALTPLLSPSRPPPAPPASPPSDPPASPRLPERCAKVCDPRELGGTGSPWVTAGGDGHAPPPRVGLLARALDALDAYVRLRA